MRPVNALPVLLLIAACGSDDAEPRAIATPPTNMQGQPDGDTGPAAIEEDGAPGQSAGKSAWAPPHWVLRDKDGEIVDVAFGGVQQYAPLQATPRPDVINISKCFTLFGTREDPLGLNIGYSLQTGEPSADCTVWSDENPGLFPYLDSGCSAQPLTTNPGLNPARIGGRLMIIKAGTSKSLPERYFSKAKTKKLDRWNVAKSQKINSLQTTGNMNLCKTALFLPLRGPRAP